MDALRYNQTRGYTDEQTKLIQKVVGANPDGIWGPKTVGAVKVWQSNNGLVVDGMVGPKTFTAMREDFDERLPCKPQDHIDIGCGLAAYDQSWPGRTPEEAMQVAWDQALSLGATEIRFWSSEWLIDETLPGGGNKGNKYSGPWLESQKVPDGVVVGAWIDDPPHSASTDRFAERLAKMHITRAALMINRANTLSHHVPWELRGWDEKRLRKIAEVYVKHGIKLVATCWPRPSRMQIDAMCEDMKWILPAMETDVFEVDTEGNWHGRYREGFKSMRDASAYLADRMRALVGDEGTLELTTFTYHGENSSKAQLAPLMDRLLPQAYSVRHRGNRKVPWQDVLGPGHHQKLAMRRARQAAS